MFTKKLVAGLLVLSGLLGSLFLHLFQHFIYGKILHWLEPRLEAHVSAMIASYSSIVVPFAAAFAILLLFGWMVWSVRGKYLPAPALQPPVAPSDSAPPTPPLPNRQGSVGIRSQGGNLEDNIVIGFNTGYDLRDSNAVRNVAMNQPTDVLRFPPPTGELTSLSNEQLAQRANDLSQVLVALSRENRGPDEEKRIFETQHRADVTSLCSEAAARVGHLLLTDPLMPAYMGKINVCRGSYTGAFVTWGFAGLLGHFATLLKAK